MSHMDTLMQAGQIVSVVEELDSCRVTLNNGSSRGFDFVGRWYDRQSADHAATKVVSALAKHLDSAERRGAKLAAEHSIDAERCRVLRLIDRTFPMTNATIRDLTELRSRVFCGDDAFEETAPASFVIAPGQEWRDGDARIFVNRVDAEDVHYAIARRGHQMMAQESRVSFEARAKFYGWKLDEGDG